MPSWSHLDAAVSGSACESEDHQMEFFYFPTTVEGLVKEIISLVNKNQKHLGLHPIAPVLASLRRCLPSPTRATYIREGYFLL